MIPIAPNAISRIACWTSSALTTGPTFVSTRTSSMGPNFCSSAARSWTSCPLSVLLPEPGGAETPAAAAGAVEPDANGEPDAAGEPEGAADGDAAGDGDATG